MSKTVRLMGLGTVVPERALTNEELSKIVDTSDAWITERTGIKERRIMSPEGRNSDLAVEAARLALADAKVAPADLGLIAVGTATPDMPFPATACFVAGKLGAGTVPAFDLTAACSGFVYAATVVQQFVVSGKCRYGMAIGSEVLSRITDMNDRGSCILFGDGAGAAVLGTEGNGPEILDTILHAGDSDRWDTLCLPAGGSAMPASEATVRERKHFIQLKGREVFKLALTRMLEVLDETLRKNGLTVDTVDLLIPHQMNRRIIEACSDRLGIPMERIMVNIEKYGNTSAASIPLAMDEARRTGRLKKGNTVVLVTFGGGFTWGTMVLKW